MNPREHNLVPDSYLGFINLRRSAKFNRQMKTTPNPYSGYRYPAEIISHYGSLYFRFALSYRDVEEILASRGIVVSNEAVRQWRLKFVQRYANKIRH